MAGARRSDPLLLAVGSLALAPPSQLHTRIRTNPREGVGGSAVSPRSSGPTVPTSALPASLQLWQAHACSSLVWVLRTCCMPLSRRSLSQSSFSFAIRCAWDACRSTPRALPFIGGLHSSLLSASPPQSEGPSCSCYFPPPCGGGAQQPPQCCCWRYVAASPRFLQRFPALPC